MKTRALPIALPQLAAASGMLLAAGVGLMVGRDPKLGLALIVACAYVPLVMISLPAGLACWVALVFVERAGFGLAGTFAGLLVLAAWLGTVSARQAALRYAFYRHRWIITGAVLLVAWFGLSIAWSEAPSGSGGELLQYGIALVAFLVVITTPSRPRHVWIIAAAFVVGAVLIVLVGFAQGGLKPSSATISTEDGYGGRLASGGMDPNYLAAGLVPAIALAAALIGHTRDPIKRLALFCAIAICALGLATTQSRGGLLAAAFALVVALVIAKGRRLGVLAVSLILVTAIGSWFVVDQAAWERVTSSTDGGTGRTELWNVAWQMSGDHPVVGVGLDQFPVRAADYARQTGSLEFSEFLVDDPKVVHNLYLQILAETGVIGLLLFFAIIAGALRATWLAIKRLDAVGSDVAELGRAILVAQVAILGASFFLSNGHDKRIWILLALGPALLTVAARLRAREEDADAPAPAFLRPRRVPRLPVGGLAGAGRLLPGPVAAPAGLPPLPRPPRRRPSLPSIPVPAALTGSPRAPSTNGPPRPRPSLRPSPSRSPSMPALFDAVPEDMRRRLEPAALRLPAIAALITALGLGWVDAGFQATTWYPAALFLLALLVLVVVLAAPAPGTIERPFALALTAFGAFTAWSFLSMLWAEIPATAWEGANRTLLFFIVVALVGLRPWPPALGGAAMGLIGGGVSLIALLTLLRDDAAQLFLGGRLGEPAGYPNAAAALWLIGFWPALHVAIARRPHPIVRGLGLGGATLLLGLALLSQSRGAALGFGVTAIVFVALHSRRWPALFALGAAGALLGRSWDPLVEVRLADTLGQLQDRFATARSSLLLSAVVAVVVGTVAAYAARTLWGEGGVPKRARKAADRTLIAGIGAALAVALVVVAVSGGWVDQRWQDFRTTDYSQGIDDDRTRFTGSLGSGRYDFYRVSLQEFRRNPVGGVGADNFSVDYLMERRTGEAPRYAHSLGFGILAQLGVVGALLFALFAGALTWGVLRVRRREGEAAGAVAVTGLAAFLAWSVHGMTDWLWEFPALSMLALGAFVIGARVRSQPPAGVTREPYGPPVARRRVLAVAGAALTVAAAISLALPGAAVRIERSAYEIQREDPGGALARLLRAGDLNPLSGDPVLARAVLARRLGQDAVATAAIAEAVRREDRNWLMQFEAGLFAAERGDRRLAIASLRRASGLNPAQPIIRDVLRRVERGQSVDANEAEQMLSSQLQRKLRPVGGG